MNPIYKARVVPDPDAFLQHLLGLSWLEVRKARREYFMAAVPRTYTYGKGVNAQSYDSAAWTPEVAAIRDLLNATDATSYDVCFLNRYDDQHNQLGWHSDDSPGMDQEHPIASVSVGAEREIWWRRIGDSGVVPKDQRQLLAHGSLFVMPAGFQAIYQHRIPKCDRACGVRVSLTFRRWKDLEPIHLNE